MSGSAALPFVHSVDPWIRSGRWSGRLQALACWLGEEWDYWTESGLRLARGCECWWDPACERALEWGEGTELAAGWLVSGLE